MNQNEITIAELQTALKIIANIIQMYGDTYLPIFVRLHEELKAAEKREELKTLAKTFSDL